MACLGVGVLFWVAILPVFGHSLVELARAAAETEIGLLRTALEVFEEDTGRYSASSEGLAALLERPSMIPSNQWKGPYWSRSSVPPDPWGKTFGYRCPPLKSTNGFDLYSLGPDGVGKSGGDDPDDINSWDRNHHWSKRYEDAYDRNRQRSALIDLWFLILCGVSGVWLVVLLILKWCRQRD
jgi:type II secretion system protein G